MSDNSGNVVDILTPNERDQQVLQLRLAGVSVAKIGAQYGLSDKAILKVLDRLLPTLDAATRARYLREAIGTLDALQSWWMGQAKTSVGAAALVLKINESRRQLLGLDSPVHLRLDPVKLVAGGEQPESSTEALLRELDRIAAERPASGFTEIDDTA